MKAFSVLSALALATVLFTASPEARAEQIAPQKARQLVTLLYRGVLFREPDPQGLAAWSQQVAAHGYPGLVRFAGNFAESAEFRDRVLTLHAPEGIVVTLYWHLLGRQVDPGAQGWVNLVAQGRAPEAVRGIVGSTEFRQKHHIH